MGCQKLTYRPSFEVLKGGFKKELTIKKSVSNSYSTYFYAFNGMEKDDEISGNGNSYDFGARMLNPRLGRFFSRDAYEMKTPDVNPYHFALNNPIAFTDVGGDSVRIVISRKVVGFVKIKLFSSGEIKKKASRAGKKAWVPVYEVTVTNDSGSSSLHYFTRDAIRARVGNDDALEDVTFDVQKDGQRFSGKIKSRWSGKKNVLEVRPLDNLNSQTIEGYKGDEPNVKRVAIQLHALGASDGCLLCVNPSKIDQGPYGGESLNKNAKTSQGAFMRSVMDMQKEDLVNGNSDFIMITFEKVKGTIEGVRKAGNLSKKRETVGDTGQPSTSGSASKNEHPPKFK